MCALHATASAWNIEHGVAADLLSTMPHAQIMRPIVSDDQHLRDEIERLKAENARQAQMIGKLTHYLRGLLRGRYGRATEKLLGDTPADQQVIAEIEAFLTAERAQAQAAAAAAPAGAPVPAAAPPAAAVASPAAPATEPPAAPRGRRQRPSLTFPQLEVRTSRVDVPEAERLDAEGRPMVACGSETVETVVFQAPEVFIQQTIYPRYRSATVIDAAGRAETAGVLVPERIVERGQLADETVAQIVIGKFADALPCNRTLEIMARAGCRLSGSVVDTAVAAMGDLLTPLADAIRADLRTAPAVGVDAAIMRCRDDRLRRTCRRTPIYTITDGTQAWYWWAPDEQHRHAPEVIAGFHRWLITDGWAGWHGSAGIGARFAGCWSHARRPFARLEEKDPDAAAMVRLIHELYLVEDQASMAEANPGERLRLRDRLSRPIVERIRAFALLLAAKHPGKGGHPCGTGARYIINQWYDLLKFLDHADLRLDNNLAEGDLRMVALIRKNSLYLGAASAGPRFAACLSVLRSCRLARINPADYLAAVTPTLINRRRLSHANLPTPDLASLTPKGWAARHGKVVSRAS
jgi:transposase